MELKSDEIKKIIPHRYPFLLIDKVTDMKPGEWVEAIKCVSANEMYFMGHFPQKQIMPGVLIIEALAQAGAVAILSMPQNKGKVAVFGGIKNCRFQTAGHTGRRSASILRDLADKRLRRFWQGCGKGRRRDSCPGRDNFCHNGVIFFEKDSYGDLVKNVIEEYLCF